MLHFSQGIRKSSRLFNNPKPKLSRPEKAKKTNNPTIKVLPFFPNCFFAPVQFPIKIAKNNQEMKNAPSIRLDHSPTKATKSQIEAIRTKRIRSEKSDFTKMKREEILVQSKKEINSRK